MFRSVTSIPGSPLVTSFRSGTRRQVGASTESMLAPASKVNNQQTNVTTQRNLSFNQSKLVMDSRFHYFYRILLTHLLQ